MGKLERLKEGSPTKVTLKNILYFVFITAQSWLGKCALQVNLIGGAHLCEMHD